MYAYPRKEPLRGKVRLLLAMSGYNPRLVGFLENWSDDLMMQYDNKYIRGGDLCFAFVGGIHSGGMNINSDTISYIEYVLNDTDGFNIGISEHHKEEIDGEIGFIYTIRNRDGGEKMAVRKG